MPRNELWAYIYALCDPLTGEPRYVGSTLRLEMRYHEHCHYGEGTWELKCWIKGLREQGLVPKLRVLDKVPSGIRSDAEMDWIEHMLSKSIPILNVQGAVRTTPRRY